jgi:prepilin-type processing-associated H-X9-DG protein
LDPNERLAQNRTTGSKGVQTTSVITPTRKFLVLSEDPKTMHNASCAPQGNAVAGTFVVHNGKANFGFVDGHIETMRSQVVVDIVRGRSNLDLLYFDPFYR